MPKNSTMIVPFLVRFGSEPPAAWPTDWRAKMVFADTYGGTQRAVLRRPDSLLARDGDLNLSLADGEAYLEAVLSDAETEVLATPGVWSLRIKQTSTGRVWRVGEGTYIVSPAVDVGVFDG